MSAATSPTSVLPSRTGTNFSSFSDDAVPEADPNTTAGLLAERLQAWKHAVGYLEDYMTAVEKIHGKHAKEYEKALKTISNPLKEGHHFDQSLGGVAGFFENMRSNTQAMINTNLETEKSIKGSVLPVLERLHKEIKHKAKELSSGAQKGSKEVEKLRNNTQKHIELLGQRTASFQSAGGKIQGDDDPYVLNRGILHRLSEQVIAENNHHNDLLAVQSNFSSFEAHVLEVLTEAMDAFTQLAGGQAGKISALHKDMLGTMQCIPREFEWKNFVTRSGERLVSAEDPPRSVDTVQFPNMDHPSIRPLIEGSLERKSRNKLSWGYSAGYYVVTPSKFLHEFKDSDNTRQDPKPELSIYLPEATIGAPNGDKFNVKGKDKSKGITSKIGGSSELAFKAHTVADAEKWFSVIRNVAGATGPAEPSSPAGESVPVTPVAEHQPTSDPDDKLPLSPPSDVATVGPAVAQVDGPVSHEPQSAGVTPAEDRKVEALP